VMDVDGVNEAEEVGDDERSQSVVSTRSRKHVSSVQSLLYIHSHFIVSTVDVNIVCRYCCKHLNTGRSEKTKT
jgi:hypothetical protein